MTKPRMYKAVYQIDHGAFSGTSGRTRHLLAYSARDAIDQMKLVLRRVTGAKLIAVYPSTRKHECEE